MHYSPFYSNYLEFVKAKDAVMVKDIITSEIANSVVERRDDIIDALNRSGMYVDSSIGTKQLSAIVSENLSNPNFVRRLSKVIGTKSPNDFESFYHNASGSPQPVIVNGKKVFRKRRPVTEVDYYNDVFMAVSGNVQKGDSDVLSKVEVLDIDDTDYKKANRKANMILLGIVAFCGLSVWAIGVKKII